jgi:hypothetical protein
LDFFGRDEGLMMSNRLDGFYWAGYQGLSPDGTWGQGVLFIKDGQIYGGDSMSLFVGTFEDKGGVLTAQVRVHPMNVPYTSVTGGLEDVPWEVPDIRGKLPSAEGALPEVFEVELDAERYDTHQAITVRLKRLRIF